MFKKLLSCVAVIISLFQVQTAFGQYSITSATETVYSGGVPTTNIFTCSQDTVVYRIIESSFTTDSLKIKLPDGITLSTLLSDSNVTVSYTIRANDSVPVFHIVPAGSKFMLKLLVNTPPCNKINSAYPYTHIWGKMSTDTIKLNTDPLSIKNPYLSATDISLPSPIVLNVGNVDEFVIKLANNGDVNSRISNICFQVTPNSNIIYYPIGGHPKYYLTHTDSVSASYHTRYNYNLPVHSLYSLDTAHTDTITSAKIKGVTGVTYLGQNDTLILHIPFFVKNCSNTNGNIKLYTECFLDSTECNIYNDVTSVSVDLGIPSLAATVDTIDNSTFCSSIHNKHKSEVRFRYTNNGTRQDSIVGSARADSLRLYMYCNTGTGVIDNTSIKINGVSIAPTYITSYTNSGFNIYLIDLTKYPAGVNGHPFGINTIYDMDGSGYADALAEDSTFEISATFIYDSTSCPPYDQCAGVETPNTFYLPGIWGNYNNQCFTLFYSHDHTLPFDSIGRDADYVYLSSNGFNTSISAPNDITNSSPDFNLNVCPSYVQAWGPLGFNFACPDAHWYLAIPMPLGYHLDFTSPDLSLVESGHTHVSPIYQYLPSVHDSGGCSHATFPISSPFPLVDEHFHSDSTQDTVFVNFGKLPLNDCYSDSATNLLPCINVPLSLVCADIPPSHIYTDNDDNLSFTLQYACDSGCSNCSNILSCGSTVTYHHCPGSCTSIPYTDSVWSFLRNNFGYINQNIAIPKYYTKDCSSGSEVVPGLPDTLISHSGLSIQSAYPGDQIQAKVNGGYDSLIPSHFSDEYLQIRYELLSFAPQPFVFELDPDDSSYFIIRGCIGVPALNGVKLYMPHCSPVNPTCNNTYAVGSPIAMNFSLSEAIQHTYPSLYTLWLADNSIEYITDTAVINLRVMNGPSYKEYPDFMSCGKGNVKLRTEFMCALPGGFSADTFHSCDSWGRGLNLLQPCSGYFLGAGTTSECDSFPVDFVFRPGAALSTDDFPYEFRPFAELDSVVTITLPQGYIYGSSTFYAYMDNFNISSENYFSGGSSRTYFPITPTSIYNPLGPLGPTVLTYKGLNNNCWPLIDSKVPNYAEPTCYNLTIQTKPLCTARKNDSIFYSANMLIATQQSDTVFQKSFKTTNSLIRVQHVNPVLLLNAPNTVTDSSNIVSFKFVLCDSLISNPITNGWIAFQNILGDSLNMRSATLYDATTHTYTTGTLYDSRTGVIFNFGDLTACNTFIFTALIDSDSRSCPPPIGGDTGKLLVRYGNVCSGTLLNPDSTTCEHRIDTFHYIVYPANLELTNNGFHPSPVSLCGGLLVDSLTITSDKLGSISDPEFWVVSQPGFTFDSVRFTYPCGGRRDTSIHVPDTTFTPGTGGGTELGWVLNKDLKLHGLMGTLFAHSSDSNTICVKVYLTMNCNYNGQPIQFYAYGKTTCGIGDTSDVEIHPAFDSVCCIHLPACVPHTTTFDVVLENADAKLLSRAMHHNNYTCDTILIEGTFKVDTTFYFYGCDVSLAPNALINIVDSSWLSIQESGCANGCSHLHAACDTMWRGIFIHKGSTLYTTDETVIEDADTAVYAINTSTQEALYNLNVSTFNKNYKDIVVKAYPKYYNSYSSNCLYTCRNFDSIFASQPYGCVNPVAFPSINYYGNWVYAPVATLLAPHAGQNTYIGWAVDTIGYFSDSLLYGSGNTFDNLQYGILSMQSNMGVYNDLFQNIINTNNKKAAITAKGGITSLAGLKLFVGKPAIGYNTLGNTFFNCTTGVIADTGFKYVDISFNKMINSSTTIGAYGVLVEAMNITGDSLFVDQDTITNFNVGIESNMNNYLKEGYINYNVISENICSNLNWTGIVINESSSPTASYTVDTNTINTLYSGIIGTGLENTSIVGNTINLGPFSCASYLANGGGIGLQKCAAAQIGCNVITSGYSHNTYTGIAAAQSSDVIIINNDITKAHVGIALTVSTTQDSLYDNTFNNEDTGIYKPSGVTMPNVGSAIPPHATDNTFNTITCRTAAPAPFITNYYISGASYIPSPGCPVPTHNPTVNHYSPPCAKVLTRSRSHSMINHAADSTYFDSATIVFMENTALSKDTFYVAQDTNAIIQKQELLPILWSNPYLLKDNILKRFYDSISNAPLGYIIAIDTAMVDSGANYANLLNTVNAIIPANNIEANLQIATLGYINYRLNGTLSSDELTTLRTLANKCGGWDGSGVYLTRALLSLFDPPSIVYSDLCDEDNHEEHKPVKKTETIESVFNLYPNPNNGGFTLAYQLEQGQVGIFTIYDMLGKKITSQPLDPNEQKMSINETTLDNGIYLYNIVVNNNVVKQDKLVIIK